MIKRLRNQHGSLITGSLVTTAVIALVSGMIMQRVADMNKNLRAPRIKAAQSSIESSLRYLLLQPTIYSGCDSNVGSSSCTVDAAQITSLFQSIPGCVGGTGGQCGVHILTGYTFNAATRTFSGKIHYDGTDLVLADRVVTIVVPQEVLQSTSIMCSTATPLFAGFDSVTGAKICRAFPNSCPAGSFVTGFNTTTLAVTCQSLDTNSRDCGLANFISGITWSAGGTLSISCTPRPVPTSLWPTSF